MSKSAHAASMYRGATRYMQLDGLAIWPAVHSATAIALSFPPRSCTPEAADAARCAARCIVAGATHLEKRSTLSRSKTAHYGCAMHAQRLDEG